MLLTEMLKARALLSYQREAARLLQEIIGSIDVAPSPADGCVRFSFQGNVEFLDRLALWGSGVEDVEPDADLEDDARDLPKATAAELDEIRAVSRGALAALNRERGVQPVLKVVTAA